MNFIASIKTDEIICRRFYSLCNVYADHKKWAHYFNNHEL